MVTKWLDKLFGRADPPAAPRARGAGARGTAGGAQNSPRAAASTGTGTAKRSGAWQAVSVVPCLEACAAAQAARNARVLVRDNPRLPLPTCTRPKLCTCKFRKYEDRRTGDQRSPYANAGGFTYSGAEKRRRRGRRSTDHEG